MKQITPEDYGRVCTWVANCISLSGWSTEQILKWLPDTFPHCDPVDLADIAESAIEQWQRLQIREPDPPSPNPAVRDSAAANVETGEVAGRHFALRVPPNSTIKKWSWD